MHNHEQESIQLAIAMEIGHAVQDMLVNGVCPSSIAIGLHSAGNLLWPDGPVALPNFGPDSFSSDEEREEI